MKNVELSNKIKERMDKNVRPYKQRGNTCAIVCMMTVLEYYKVIEKANWYDERRLYKIYGSKCMSGTPFSALAFHMAKNGLDTTIYHESQNLFENSHNALNKEDFEFAMKEYKEYLGFARNNGAKVSNGISINVDILKQKLQEGNLVILAGELSGGYHAILLTGYSKFGFMVCDPLYKAKQTRTFEEIKNFMNTSIGKWFIAINDKTKEKDKLISNLDKFSEEVKGLIAKK